MNSFLRLCRSELHRLTARRMTRWLSIVYVAVIVGMCIIAAATHTKHPGPGDKIWTVDDTSSAVQAMVGFGAGLAFLLGASAGGAEWAQKTMQALLFWETRRVRVIAAKVAALSVVAAAMVLIGQVLTIAGTRVVTLTSGTTAGYTGHEWSDILGTQARGLLVAILTAAAAFSIASLTRNTGAALGAAFLYFVIIEQVIHAWKPWTGKYLVSPNIAALVAGHVNLSESTKLVVIHSGRAGVTICVYVAVLLGITTALFVRRDVT
jgi:ABC-type transport system involved in multi-copper enzyme maturation permease subunit